MSISIVQMAPTVKIIIEQVFSIKPGEKVCVFTDTQCSQGVTELLAAGTQAAGAETVIVTIIPREVGGVDPPSSRGKCERHSGESFLHGKGGNKFSQGGAIAESGQRQGSGN